MGRAHRPDHRGFLEAHLLLITHGRRICVARRPRCGECPLLELCPYGRSSLGAAAAG